MFTIGFQKMLVRSLLSLPRPVTKLIAGTPTVVDGQVMDSQFQMLNQWFPSNEQPPYNLNSLRKRTDVQGTWLAHTKPRNISAEDIGFTEEGKQVDIRIYGNLSIDIHSPAILYFHGGGHVSGSIESHDGICRYLAWRTSSKVFSVNYRLAPEHCFPAGIEDSMFAFNYLYRHADVYGIDAKKIAVMGDSAGANIAAVVAQQCRGSDAQPCHQVLVAPWLDMSGQVPRSSYRSFAKGYVLETAALEWFAQVYLPENVDASDERASPLWGCVDGVAPATIMVAGFDPLRDEGLDYARKLRKAKVETDLHFYEGLPHAFLNMAGYLETADAAFDAIVNNLSSAFFR